MTYHHNYPLINIKPLNFDDTMTDDENEENNDPATSADEDVKMTSYCSEDKMLLNESTYDLSCDFSSNTSPDFSTNTSLDLSSNTSNAFSSNTTFTTLNKNLRRSFYAYLTPVPNRVNRKRKYCEPVTSNTILSYMPNEILNRVFSFCNKRDLLAIGSTCKRFYDVTSTQTHWAKINLCGKRVIESALHRMISRKTKSLCMISTVVFLDPLLESRKFSECSLTRLDLSWAKFPGSDLSVMKGILRRCTQLQHLGLESQTIDAEVLEMVAKNRDLLTLNLSSCQIIDPDALSLVFKSCNKLKDLCLSWTYPNEATAAVIVNKIPTTIEKFAIAGMCDRAAFNDAGLYKILSRCPNLTELDIGDNSIATSAFIIELAKRKNFRKLTACRCFSIEPIAYTTMKYARVMNLFGSISESGYDFMRKRLPNVSFNLNPIATIGRSQDTDQPNIFWGEDISEPY